jgi:hypothetical protein
VADLIYFIDPAGNRLEAFHGADIAETAFKPSRDVHGFQHRPASGRGDDQPDHHGKINDDDPQAWLADVLARIAEHPFQQLDELLPQSWRQLNVRNRLVGPDKLNPANDPAAVLTGS